jgi:hypothetical protein
VRNFIHVLSLRLAYTFDLRRRVVLEAFTSDD